MPRQALHAAIALTLLLTALAGCSLLGGDEPVRQERAVDALASARERVQSAESFAYEMSFTAETSDGSERLDGDGTGRVNVTARKMAANTTVEGRTSAVYVDEWTAYQECPTQGHFWGRSNVTADNWTAVTPLGRQLSLLSTGDLYWNGTETVAGRELVHVSGSPSKKALRERSDELGSAPLLGSRNIDRVTVDAWLDPDTHRPARTRVAVTITADGRTVTATVTTRYDEYGDPVAVSVPPGAREHAFDSGCPGS